MHMGASNKWIVPGSILAAAALAVVGTSLVNSLQANAATGTTAATGTATAQTAAATDAQVTPPDPSRGGHVGSNGTKEVELTGDSAEKAKAAALAAVPGGTVIRVENDADGQGTYEAHMKKADGSLVTVLMDASYKVTSTETGMGGPGGPQGGQPATQQQG
jgi:uncharacterized membrane protein YkoI